MPVFFLILEPIPALSPSRRLKINQIIRNFLEQYYFRLAITKFTTKPVHAVFKKGWNENIYNRGRHENYAEPAN